MKTIISQTEARRRAIAEAREAAKMAWGELATALAIERLNRCLDVFEMQLELSMLRNNFVWKRK